ncbi:MAG: putative transcriptional Regulator AsnC family [Rhodospirillaceae bacterium]|nr:MAG: putative transcriptional Regulator AsnC family [Rhodospirillaceae bacterium]
MELTERDRRFVAAIQGGLPLVERPYHAIGAATGLSEDEVLHALAHMMARGLITRFGVVLRHRFLGYRANAMVVWDIPDGQVAEAGERLAPAARK